MLEPKSAESKVEKLKGIHDPYAPLVLKHNVRKCDGCGEKLALPHDLVHLDDNERPRPEQFFLGGLPNRAECYNNQPACDCGMRIDPSLFAEHFRQAHHN